VAGDELLDDIQVGDEILRAVLEVAEGDSQ
jgi:hypothetical protein